MNKTKINIFKDYFLVYMLIAVSGIPYFTADYTAIIISFVISLYIFLRRNLKFNKFYLKFIVLLLFIHFLQIITFQFFKLNSIISTIIFFSFPYLVLKIVGRKIIEIYIDIMYVFAIISLFFFVLTIAFPSFYYFLLNNVSPYFERDINNNFYSYNTNILVYTLKSYGEDMFHLYRNSGPFWEAGAYGGFLIIAFILNFFKTSNLFDKKNIVFLVSIISTLSIGAFFALFGFLIVYFYKKGIKSIFLFIPIILLIAYQAYTSVGFISEKINGQIESVEGKNVEDIKSRERLASFLLDFKKALSSPLIGYGKNVEVKFGITDKQFSYENHRNNGMGYLAITYGFPFMLIYFFFLYQSSKSISLYYYKTPKYGLSILIAFLLLGFSQVWYSKPIFILFNYLWLAFYKELFYKNQKSWKLQ